MTPFAKEPAETVAGAGESVVISRIRASLGATAPAAPEGPGDDCAVVDSAPFPGKRLVTADAVVWGRHFDASVTAAEAGRKLVNRNLSDIAAMGGVPTDAVLSLLMGGDVNLAWLEAFVAGMAVAAGPVGLKIVGGDVARVPDGFFAASLTLTGFAERPLLRTGALPGDFLYVTGELGGSILGRHHAFSPRLAEGRFFAAHPAVRAGIDVTDGPAKDLPALLPARAVAMLDLGALPASPAAQALAARDGTTPAHHALADGEDYELLIAVAPDGASGLELVFAAAFPGVRLTRIGRIVPAAGLVPGGLYDETGALLGETGYDHFAGQDSARFPAK